MTRAASGARPRARAVAAGLGWARRVAACGRPHARAEPRTALHAENCSGTAAPPTPKYLRPVPPPRIARRQLREQSTSVCKRDAFGRITRLRRRFGRGPRGRQRCPRQLAASGVADMYVPRATAGPAGLLLRSLALGPDRAPRRATALLATAALLATLALLALLTVENGARRGRSGGGGAAPAYVLVIDAGSSGTRM
eukprot:359072-Chlamydomonas_euryale.AAC.4